MTTWNLLPKVGTGWTMNDPLVTMNDSEYTMNSFSTNTVWQILSSLSTLVIIYNFI